MKDSLIRRVFYLVFDYEIRATENPTELMRRSVRSRDEEPTELMRRSVRSGDGGPGRVSLIHSSYSPNQ